MTHRPLFLLSTIESDSHTWNLVFLQLFLEEEGIEVLNLGACVPAATTLEALRCLQPDALVISSVNGHGYWQGRALQQAAARLLGKQAPPLLIGGKLTTCEDDNATIAGELREAGFADVFVGEGALDRFSGWLQLFKQTFSPRGQAGSNVLEASYESDNAGVSAADFPPLSVLAAAAPDPRVRVSLIHKFRLPGGAGSRS